MMSDDRAEAWVRKCPLVRAAQRFCFLEEVFFGGLRTAQKTTAERAFQLIARAQQQVLYSLQNGLHENGPAHNVGAKQDVYRMHECALEMFDALMITPEKRQDMYFAQLGIDSYVFCQELYHDLVAIRQSRVSTVNVG
ncbi:hypothetical protein PsorP6_001141 [Peronosclerospora sorghi]|uniref:Uncharacterized protein n=1 Tax=Peronosclerospora sorghi TaxID=230839 RepID=A0ACC0WR97_9STRA|nr:hypothetical protein PsorP6_001141 [Peronosclerospora sorghi]